MSFFRTPYDTTALKGSKGAQEKLLAALTRARIERYIQPVPKNPYVYAVQRSNVLDELVPTFHHTVVQDVSGQPVVYVDVRPYGKIDGIDLSFKVTAREDYQAALLRARLQESWATGNTSSIRSLQLPAMVFTSWISENIQRVLNLGPGDQATIAILAGIYYLSLFTDIKPEDEDDKSLIITQVARNTGIKPDIVKEVVNDIDYIADVSDFCLCVRERLDNVRANNLNPATLYSMLAGTWYGANSAELVAVSLEHPPTWVTLIYRAATNRSFHKARLATMVNDRHQFKNQIRNFVISLLPQD